MNTTTARNSKERKGTDLVYKSQGRNRHRLLKNPPSDFYDSEEVVQTLFLYCLEDV